MLLTHSQTSQADLVLTWVLSEPPPIVRPQKFLHQDTSVICERRSGSGRTHMYCMHFLCSYTKHKFKDKTVKTFRRQQRQSSEHLWGAWVVGSGLLHTSHTLEARSDLPTACAGGLCLKLQTELGNPCVFSGDSNPVYRNQVSSCVLGKHVKTRDEIILPSHFINRR